MSLTRNRRRPASGAAPQEPRVVDSTARVPLNRPQATHSARPIEDVPSVAPVPRQVRVRSISPQTAGPAQAARAPVQVRVAPRTPRAALFNAPAVLPSNNVRTRKPQVDEDGPELGNSVLVAATMPANRVTPHWSQSERWFWLTYPETQERELVKPAGTTHVQGPFEMVQFTTQGGSLKTCSVTFFETNSQLWSPGKGMR